MRKILAVLAAIVLVAVTILNYVLPSWYGVAVECLAIFLFIAAIPFIRCRASLYGFVLGYVINIVPVFRLVHAFGKVCVAETFFDVTVPVFWMLVIFLTFAVLQIIAHINAYIAGMIWTEQDALAK